MNISTSAQITFVVENYQPGQGPPQPTPLEYLPYFKNDFIAAAASLNGGNSLATFVKMLQQWTMDLGFSVPQCEYNQIMRIYVLEIYLLVAKVWEKVISLSSEDSATSNLKIEPTCLGERYNPNLTASVSNIHVGNLQLGQVFRALCQGLLENLHR